MFKNNKSIILPLIIFSWVAEGFTAEYNFEKLISCENSNGFDKSCKLISTQPQKKLIQKPKWKNHYIVTYNMTCNPGNTNSNSSLKLVSKNAIDHYFKHASSGTLTFDSSEDVFVVDSQPAKLRSLRYYPSCNLSLHFTSSIASSVKEGWRNELAALEKEKKDAIISRDGFSTLIAFKGVFVILNQVVNSLAQDLSRNYQLRKSLEALTTCPSNGSNGSCNIFYDLATSDSDEFSSSEKMAVLKLSNIISQLPPVIQCEQNVNCKSTVLKEHLGVEDINALSSLSKRISDANDAENNYQYFEKKILDLDSKISTITAYLKLD